MAILEIMQYDTTRINETLVLSLGCLWLTRPISANPPRSNLNSVSFPFAQKHQSSQSPKDYMSIKFPPPWEGKAVKCRSMPGEMLKLRFDRHITSLRPPPATTREKLHYVAIQNL